MLSTLGYGGLRLCITHLLVRSSADWRGVSATLCARAGSCTFLRWRVDLPSAWSASIRLRRVELAIMPEGTVEVEIIKGLDLKNVEFFGKSDPYSILAIGEQKQRTKTIHDGGKNPVWNESFLFEIPDGPHELSIQVFDQERHGSDEIMGSVSIPLVNLFVEKHIAPCTHKVQLPNGKFEGELHVGLRFFPKVHHGVLDVHLMEAHGLLDSDVFGKSDPYAVIYCHNEIQRSRVIQHTVDPVWNEHFRFQVNSEVTEALIKLFDKDDLKADDPLGNAVVPLHKVFAGGEVEPMRYKVLGPKGQPQGELSAALKFSSMG